MSRQSLLRFMTCGSVDDGKSTLIGRLLFDAQLVRDDELAALQKDSRQHGTTGAEADFALLLDGLEAEREQSITIDVGYRYFSTRNRSFIVADAPGHEQHTRNMATAASTSDVAVILVDARKGIKTQTRRHTAISSLFGTRHVVLAVNKIDLIDYAQPVFERISDEYRAFCSQLSFNSIVAIPVSARFGDNVASASANTGWYRGPTILEHLETVDVETDLRSRPFRFVVQLVSRPHPEFRGYAGRVASGRLRRHSPVAVARSGITSRIARIVTQDGDLEEAQAGDAVTLTLADEIDVARGDLLTDPGERPNVADQFTARILWLDAQPMLPGRTYLARFCAQWELASVSSIKHKIDVNDLKPLAARKLELNELGLCNLSTSNPVAFDAFDDNCETGPFILVDRDTNQTCAAGMIAFALRRAINTRIEPLAVDKSARAALKHQRPCVLWFTGLPASGKSTIARIVEQRLAATGHHTYMLDGDNLRHGLNRDLGFSDADRVENVRRAGEVARILADAGIVVLCSFISPFRAERRAIREHLGNGEFIEIFVDTPLEECERRDPKGLYAKARAGELPNFTGIDSPYEPPDAAELVLSTMQSGPQDLAEKVTAYLDRFGYLRGAVIL
jgi:bifunctional enzyme CysN/CysC